MRRIFAMPRGRLLARSRARFIVSLLLLASGAKFSFAQEFERHAVRHARHAGAGQAQIRAERHARAARAAGHGHRHHHTNTATAITTNTTPTPTITTATATNATTQKSPPSASGS